MKRAAGIVAGIAIGLAAIAAAPANAAVTCSYDGGIGLVSVEMTTSNDAAEITRTAGGDINVNGTACTGATVTNTTNVPVDDNSTGGTSVEIERPADFAPGVGVDEDAVPEIEFVLSLGNGLDTVELTGGDAANRIHVGASGANVNAVAGDGDADIIPLGAIAEIFNLIGGPADDLLTAQGGAGPARRSPAGRSPSTGSAAPT